MLTALKVAGLVLVILVVVIAIVGYIIIAKIKKFARAALEASANSLPPIRITLTPESEPEWRSQEQIDAWSEEFKKLGFVEAGVFSMPEMNGLLMKGFCHTGENLYGAIYDHQKIPPTFDIVCSYEDGTSLSATNTTFGDSIDCDPTDERIRLDTLSVAEVLDTVFKKIKDKPRIPRTPEGFAANFVREYAKEMNSRMKKGGATREEIRRQAQKDGTEITEEQLEEVYTDMRAQYVSQLQDACIAQFLDESRLPVVEWQQMEHRAFAIPETLEWKEVLEILETQAGADEEQAEELKKLEFPFGTDALQMMEKVIDEGIAGFKFEKRGEVQEPVRAYILLTPA